MDALFLLLSRPKDMPLNLMTLRLTPVVFYALISQVLIWLAFSYSRR